MQPTSDASLLDARTFDARANDASCDGDGDGYPSAACGVVANVDCMDGNPDVHPGAYDTPANTVDEDCLDGDATVEDSIRPNEASTGGNGINFINGYVQALLGSAHGHTISELGGTVYGGPDFIYNGAGNERYAGVHVWETYFSYALQTAVDPMSHAIGRAVVQIEVPGWQAFATDVGMEGTTIYTVFPDGRTHVQHDFEVMATAGSNFNTAYVSLQPTAIDNVVWTAGGGGTATVGSLANGMSIVHNPQNGDPSGYLCGYQSVGGLVVGFGYQVPGTPRSGPRITENNVDSEHWIALQYDFTAGEPVQLGNVSGDFLLYVGGGGPGTPCDPVQARVQPWRNPPVLTLTSPGTLVTNRVGDRNGDGYVEGGGYYALDAGGAGEITVTVDTTGGRAAPATSAFRIQGLDLSHDPTVHLGGMRLGHGEEYLWQVEGDVGWLYLGVPLSNGAQVVIRAP